MEYPSNDHKNHPNQHKNSHKLCNEKWYPFGVLMKVKGDLGKNIRICQLRGSDCGTSDSSEEINQSKRVGLRESLGVRGRSGKVNHLAKVD